MRYLLIFCIVLSSCAKIPVQSVELSQALKEEGERMHLLNLALIDKIFQEKRHLVNEFITNEYTPEIVNNFKSLLPPGTDYEADFAEMMQALYPRINARKDSLVSALDEQKAGIIDKLNQDYKVYASAFDELQNLLRSASRLNQKRTEVFQQIKSLTNNRLNLEGIDKALNKFIKDGGNIGDKAVILSNSINSLLK
ncbi:MAG: hypothetical protein J0L56_15885 [Chitinophagales bacterium]|nr:hypothetical protein [Chitinophagales bacterium]